MKKYILFIVVLGLIVSCKNKNEDSQVITTTVTNKSDVQVSIEQGEILYKDFCMQCHLTNGKGIPNSFPPLANSNWLTEKRSESIHSVKYGQNEEIVVNGMTYNGVMVPMGLTNTEIADVLNYVMNSWGNTQKTPVTPEEVSAINK